VGPFEASFLGPKRKLRQCREAIGAMLTPLRQKPGSFEKEAVRRASVADLVND